MNTQQIQDTLDYFILGFIALYTIIMLVDFTIGLVHLWHQVVLNIEDCNTSNISSQVNTRAINKNSLVNVENANFNSSITNYSADQDAPFKIINENNPCSSCGTSLQSGLELKDFVSIDVNKIDLRTARKIASAINKVSKPKSDLIIKQKVNGKSVPLAWLQAQIKNRVEIAPEIVRPIIQELAPAATHNNQQNIQTRYEA